MAKSFESLERQKSVRAAQINGTLKSYTKGWAISGDVVQKLLDRATYRPWFGKGLQLLRTRGLAKEVARKVAGQHQRYIREWDQVADYATVLLRRRK